VTDLIGVNRKTGKILEYDTNYEAIELNPDEWEIIDKDRHELRIAIKELGDALYERFKPVIKAIERLLKIIEEREDG
jgi:hypothetical protein